MQWGWWWWCRIIIDSICTAVIFSSSASSSSSSSVVVAAAESHVWGEQQLVLQLGQQNKQYAQIGCRWQCEDDRFIDTINQCYTIFMVLCNNSLISYLHYVSIYSTSSAASCEAGRWYVDHIMQRRSYWPREINVFIFDCDGVIW